MLNPYSCKACPHTVAHVCARGLCTLHSTHEHLVDRAFHDAHCRMTYDIKHKKILGQGGAQETEKDK